MPNKFVYMDYNATTPLHPLVKQALVDNLDLFANASSMHEQGRQARSTIEAARLYVAQLIGAQRNPEQLVFTSGGSESNNTVFATMFHLGRKQDRNQIITTAIEHPCVLNAAKWLESEGFPVHFLGVDGDGRIDLAELARLVNDKTLLVSIMAANNEIGTLQDMPAIGRIVKPSLSWLHCDATQAVGKIPVDVESWQVDYLTLSSHKLYGPKGVGGLFVRKGAPLEPLIRGGHQEHGRRAGTYNSGAIAAFGLAASLARQELPEYGQRLRALRTRLVDGLLAAIPKIRVNGHPEQVLPNTLNISFPGAEGEAILLHLDLAGIAVSTGSACASGSLDPSHVLMATGVGPELAHGSIRFSLGRGSTADDVDYVLATLPGIIARLRSMSTVSF
ncbi:MAG: cysteine desulfurase NifS [Spirochaetes bacterium GWD1_61_31]|nr:MAG: cysteine desulfurase NifS [Spirochaetes bacterium GWB1_60_80]OHD30156.1 MAG: cysteine desulfurase NifS [Spirochaetes bacterium GWC1_61_12]OHD34589.1 MAG: cysteine desulfurase NifS [Spirochaetes bacterium GWD1_61_31]OHD46405.1 MAG: cysteine desulfurase NifS [Spirochaetes bacterium GWE1_60_18]OHD59461.1 MAG: cysteine desulfurase NifS [Spirochaetes bacterium GWF1_60_12]HAP43546.1 cysteine desulfurase NifS [Spirochaetaceae bacterium]